MGDIITDIAVRNDITRLAVQFLDPGIINIILRAPHFSASQTAPHPIINGLLAKDTSTAFTHNCDVFSAI